MLLWIERVSVSIIIKFNVLHKNIMAIELSNLVFYHIPKTGGTWVKQALLNSCYDVRVVRDAKWDVHQTPDVYITKKRSFCFVRHPETWYRSYWDYRLWDKNNPDWLYINCWDKNYNKFLKNVIDKSPRYLTKMYKEYTKGIDFVGKQENLQEDLIAVLKSVGETFDEDRLRKTQKCRVGRNRSVVCDEGLLKELLGLESWIIDKFYKGRC